MSTKPAKKTKKAPKSLKAAPSEAEVPQISAEQAMMEQEELEEQQEAAAARSSTSSESALAAAAAAGPSTEASASFKNFRHHPDMENFYRFIHENDLRLEAKVIIDQIMLEKQARKALKQSKSQAH